MSSLAVSMDVSSGVGLGGRAGQGEERCVLGVSLMIDASFLLR